MIKKFICWAWGHKLTYRIFDKYIPEIDADRYTIHQHTHCPRCGVKLN